MPRTCTVCASPHRDAIDVELLGSKPIRAMARQYHLGREALTRHRDAHLPEAIAQAHQAAEVAHSDHLLETLERYRIAGEAILLGALNGEMVGELQSIEDLTPDLMPVGEADDLARQRWARPELALRALRELRPLVELTAKVEGELEPDDDEARTVHVVYENAWDEAQALAADDDLEEVEA